jgi:hypothetical protein
MDQKRHGLAIFGVGPRGNNMSNGEINVPVNVLIAFPQQGRRLRLAKGDHVFIT